MYEVIFLSIVQGITEFLPISSSAHLILITKYFNFNYESLILDVSLHSGSLLAIVFYFRKDLLDFIDNKILFIRIILSSIPVIFVGFLLIKFDLVDNLRNYKIIGWTTIFFGILLYLSDQIKVKKKTNKDFSLYDAFYIGIFQILSLVPGVSRSGITITAGRFLKFDRVNSAKISFLVSIPTLCAVSFFNIFSIYEANNFTFSLINLLAIFLSFIFSYITIKYFLYYIKRFSLTLFVIYRLLLGILILFFSYL